MREAETNGFRFCRRIEAGSRRMKWIRVVFLVLKYWLRGEPWNISFEYAKFLVFGFKTHKNKSDH